MRALIARRCRSRGYSFRSAPPLELLSRALLVIRQRLLFFTRHLAELPLVGLRCILAGAALKRDDQSHPENIVTRDPVLGAKARHFFVALPVVLDDQPEKSPRRLRVIGLGLALAVETERLHSASGKVFQLDQPIGIANAVAQRLVPRLLCEHDHL